jgi:hypothetical protein
MQGDGPLLLSGDIRTQSWIRSSWQLICGVLIVPFRCVAALLCSGLHQRRECWTGLHSNDKSDKEASVL